MPRRQLPTDAPAAGSTPPAAHILTAPPVAAPTVLVAADELAASASHQVYRDIAADAARIFGVEQGDLSFIGPAGLVTGDPLSTEVLPSKAAALRSLVADSARTVLVSDCCITPEGADGHLVEGLRFFAGTPLISADGTILGVLSVMSASSLRADDDERVRALERLAGHGVWLLELGRRTDELQHDRVVLTSTGSVLEMIVADAPLDEVLDTIARSVEAVLSSGPCTILVRDGNRLRYGAAPSLPSSFRESVDGMLIGPDAGPCGAAAFSGVPTLSADVASDPRWEHLTEFALGLGLRACYSVPVLSPDGLVVGTFALYRTTTDVPSADELSQVSRWVNLAEVAISRAHSIAALRAAATSDVLTGLANRDALLQRLQHRLQGLSGAQTAVLFVDLDQFKVVNDTLGHHVGDHFLQQAAERLRACAGELDVVSRFGGDEFVVVTCGDRERVDALAERINTSLSEPVTALGNTISMSASIGVSAVMPTAVRPSALSLVSDADLAMYDAKRGGHGGWSWFEPGMRSRAQDRLQVQVELEQAIGNGELRCAYQPEVELRSGRIVGVEALLRWQSPRRGAVQPLSFIPLAEESGLILAIGALVLREACAQLAEWRTKDPAWDAVTMWVNVSPHQLVDPGFGPMVRSVLAASGLPATALGLEITESVLMADERSAGGVLQELRSLGIRVAIDDFGTGFSSMARLKHLPVDVLKIDREFVVGIAEDAIDAQIVASLLVLAGSLGLQVIAEGVETRAQRDRLEDLGCGWAQGFLWSHPRPVDELGSLVLDADGMLDGDLANARASLW